MMCTVHACVHYSVYHTHIHVYTMYQRRSIDLDQVHFIVDKTRREANIDCSLLYIN